MNQTKDDDTLILAASQRVLTDITGLPFRLLDWRDLLTIMRKRASAPEKAIASSALTRWSRHASLYRLFDIDSKLGNRFYKCFLEWIADVRTRCSEGLWESAIFAGFGGYSCFVAPIARILEDGRRRLAYILIGGPIEIRERVVQSGDPAETLGRGRWSEEAQLEKGFTYRLLGESFAIQTRSSEDALHHDIETLRYVLNGVVRDVLGGQQETRSEVEALVAELFVLLSRREAYSHLLRLILGSASEGMAAGVFVRNQLTRTGVFFFRGRVDGEEETANGAPMMFLVPSAEQASRIMRAMSWDEVPKDHLRDVELPEDSGVSSVWGADGPASDVLRVFVWFRKQREATAAARRTRWFEDLLGMLGPFAATQPVSIRNRVHQADSSSTLEEQSQLSELVLSASYSTRRADIGKGEQFSRMLASAAPILGYGEATYYRPDLSRTPPVGVPFAWYRAVRQPCELHLEPELLSTLFTSMSPCLRIAEGQVFLPVASQNRCLGILKFEYQGRAVRGAELPGLLALASRMGYGLLFRRLLEILGELVPTFESGEEAGSLLAKKLSLLLCEGGCTIWRFFPERRRFEVEGRHGLDIPLVELGWEEAKGTLVGRCFSAGKPLEFDLGTDAPAAVPTEVITEQGFTHGIGIPVRERDSALVVFLWSRTQYEQPYFSDDDIAIVRTVGSIALRFLLLDDLMKLQRTLHDKILAGLGHELRAPLAAIEEGVSVALRSEDVRMAHDLELMARYSRALVETWFTFAELRRASEADHSSEAVSRQLFQDIAFPVHGALKVMLQEKDLEVVHDFEPESFPSYVALTGEEERYVFCILFNLLQNAIKYTPRDGGKKITVKGRASGSWIVLSVSNDGIGVPAAEADKIFGYETRGSNAFLTAPTGSGLGLYICREFAKQLGGKLVLESKQDPTTFALYIPKSKARWDFHG